MRSPLVISSNHISWKIIYQMPTSKFIRIPSWKGYIFMYKETMWASQLNSQTQVTCFMICGEWLGSRHLRDKTRVFKTWSCADLGTPAGEAAGHSMSQLLKWRCQASGRESREKHGSAPLLPHFSPTSTVCRMWLKQGNMPGLGLLGQEWRT